MPWDSGLNRFRAHVGKIETGILPAVALLAHESIQTGRPETNAPGQPVDEGNLRASWLLGFPEPQVAEVTTKTEYAMENETGVRADGRPYIQRSPVGGRHSVELTVLNFPRLVKTAEQQLRGAA